MSNTMHFLIEDIMIIFWVYAEHHLEMTHLQFRVFKWTIFGPWFYEDCGPKHTVTLDIPNAWTSQLLTPVKPLYHYFMATHNHNNLVKITVLEYRAVPICVKNTKDFIKLYQVPCITSSFLIGQEDNDVVRNAINRRLTVSSVIGNLVFQDTPFYL